MKFCCDRFESRWESPSEKGMNIRVLKFAPNELMMATKSEYRFFITPGYLDINTWIPLMNIAYCPFCGIHLFEFYNDDCYINETSKGFNNL